MSKPTPAQNAVPTNNNTVLLIVSWLWVGIPLAWGLSQTIMKAAALFK
jgi:hypothetical protein